MQCVWYAPEGAFSLQADFDRIIHRADDTVDMPLIPVFMGRHHVFGQIFVKDRIHMGIGVCVIREDQIGLYIPDLFCDRSVGVFRLFHDEGSGDAGIQFLLRTEALPCLRADHIAERIETDRFPVVEPLNRLDVVGVVADDDIGARIGQLLRQSQLFAVRLMSVLGPPVHGYDHKVRLFPCFAHPVQQFLFMTPGIC